jgi:hypothetical protein
MKKSEFDATEGAGERQQARRYNVRIVLQIVDKVLETINVTDTW